MYNISSNALQGQPAHSPGQATRHPGLFHVVDGRPAKGKSVDNGRTDNAFALTARRDNNTLPPGCRYALPWAMRFCAFSATITDMNFRIRIFNYCTSNCTPYSTKQLLYVSVAE